MALIDKVERVLEGKNYDYSEYSGCFDIVARRHETLLLKVLDNIDSFQEGQSNNLKILSAGLDASTFLIGNHTRRENLRDGVLYDRFGVFAMTVGTLESVMDNELPVLYRNRGGMFAEIDPEKLRKRRTEAGLSQAELAKKLGISKKSIYEHESRKMRAEYDIVKKMERLIGSVTDPVNMKQREPAETQAAKGGFPAIVSNDLKKMGLETSFVTQTPFNIVAHSENFLVISDAEERAKRAERNAPFLKGFAKTTDKPILVVTRQELDLDVPSIPEKELRELDNMKELKRFLNRW